MRITYRKKGSKDYWADRWADIPADNAMENTEAYPLKYAELTVTDKDNTILEAGCGAGRILRYYHERGFSIKGFDYIDIAIEKLKDADKSLDVEVADITQLHYEDESYHHVLAFGLYHNLENDLEKSIEETYRVLKQNGTVCASFRADNIQTRLTDWLTDRKSKGNKSEEKFFHKRNLTSKEFKALFSKAGFTVEQLYPVENMPILYKFKFFRARQHKTFNENLARKEGYKLSFIGQLLQNFLMQFFPNQFCNIYVIIARK